MLLGGLALTACGDKDEAELLDGPELYDTYCGLCHGSEGEGYLADRANALGNPEFLALADDAFLTDSTRRGRSGSSMTAWSEAYGGPLSDAEIDLIVAYVRGWETLEPRPLSTDTIAGDVGNGEALYLDECSHCHGNAGEGISALSLSSPEFLEVVPDEFLQIVIAEGRTGTAMPAYQDSLTADEIDDIVAFIRSWEG